MVNRLKASELPGRSQADFVDRHEHEHELVLPVHVVHRYVEVAPASSTTQTRPRAIGDGGHQ